MKNFFKIMLMIITTIGTINLSAQEQEEPILDNFRKNFNSQYFNLGILVQVVGDFQLERNISGNNGFNLANFRLKMNGELDKGLGYTVQTAFTKSPAILDAKVYYKLSDAAIFDVGLFKAPFSAEFLIGAPDIDFVNRSNVVSSLAPNRQLGFQFSGKFPNSRISYYAGIFNGNKFAGKINDNNDFMYVGRIAFNPFLTMDEDKSKMIEFGVNAAYSKDNDVNIPTIDNSFKGKRTLFGGDTRFNFDRVLLSGEVIYGKFESGNSIAEPFGYQATFGFMILENFQTLLRWDSYKLDSGLDASEQFILGFNFWPTTISELQLNYIIPTDSMIKHNQLLVNAQISL